MALIREKSSLLRVLLTCNFNLNLGILQLIWGALEDFTLRVLLVSAAISIIANEVVADEPREIGNMIKTTCN